MVRTTEPVLNVFPTRFCVFGCGVAKYVCSTARLCAMSVLRVMGHVDDKREEERVPCFPPPPLCTCEIIARPLYLYRIRRKSWKNPEKSGARAGINVHAIRAKVAVSPSGTERTRCARPAVWCRAMCETVRFDPTGTCGLQTKITKLRPIYEMHFTWTLPTCLRTLETNCTCVVELRTSYRTKPPRPQRGKQQTTNDKYPTKTRDKTARDD